MLDSNDKLPLSFRKGIIVIGVILLLGNLWLIDYE